MRKSVRRALLSIPATAGALIVFMATVPPEQARSALMKWAAAIGVIVPSWLISTRAVAGAVAVVLLFYAWYFRRYIPFEIRLKRKPSQPQTLIDAEPVNAANMPRQIADATRTPDLEAQLADKDKQLAERDEQLVRAEEALKQHTDALRYGETHFRPTPLLPLDLGFLRERLTHLRPRVDDAGESIQAVMWALTTQMLQTPASDARYWLGEEINSKLITRLRSCRERFDAEVDAGTDAREALAAFSLWYEESRRWVSRMLEFLGISLDSLQEAKRWIICNRQYVDALKETLEFPQFTPLKGWMQWSAHNQLSKTRPDGLP